MTRPDAHTRREVYADHAATTRIAPEVLAAMEPFLRERFGNPSSVHRRGDAAREALEAARAQVASLIGALPEEIVFTSSGSEANNLALKGVMSGATAERRRIVITAIEHPSVLETARHLESHGFPLTVVAVERDGTVSPDRVREALGPDVALVSVMAVNNETGVIQPVREIATLAHAAGARFHCDAIQAAGKLPLDVAESEMDLVSLAGHKFGGPPGAAALWVRRRVRLIPRIHGGHQERSRRAGTENLPAIVGLGAAAERAGQRLAAGATTIVARLGERLLDGLRGAIPETTLNGDPVRRLAGVVNLCVHGVDGEALLHELDHEGVTISTGSACSAASPGPSHVLIAMGLSPEEAHASVRFSLGEDNDDTDVEHILKVTPPAVARLRALAGASGAERARA